MDLQAPLSLSQPLSTSGPRERALEQGISSLGDAELLAVLLGTGLAGRPVSLVAAGLLDRVAGLEGLQRQSPSVIAEHPGIGLAKALRISAAIELGQRVAQRLARPRVKLCTSLAVAEYLRPALAPLAHEEMWVISLDGRNCLRSARRVGQGGLHICVVEPRDILRVALTEAATAMILVHNHPSGDPMPSPSDASLTRMVAALGKLMGLPLVDHVIIAPDGRYCSLLDQGVINPYEE